LRVTNLHMYPPDARAPARAARRAALLLLSAALLTGCAAADKTMTESSSASMSGGSSTSASSSSSSTGGMNMSVGSSTSSNVSVNGIKPVPSQLLATSIWQGMRIEARTMTPAPFVIYNGTSEQMVKPGPKTSFHLMVMLNDAHTGVAIPYATVWATISKGSKVVFDERQWPMISAFMGPHYGNNVSLPGAGTYQLSLLISPPVSARHVEYQNVWLKPHRVTATFHWSPSS
jgi:hypothetical protein